MVIFKNKYGELRSGFAILIGLGAMFGASLLFSIAFDYIVLAAVDGNMGKIAMLNSSVIFVMFVILMRYAVQFGAIILAFRLIYKRPLRELGFVKRHWGRHLLAGLGLGVVMIGLSTGILLLTGMATIDLPVHTMSNIFSTRFLYGIVLFIAVGFFEELVCRGFIMTALKTTRSRLVIVFLPSVIFALGHLANDNVSIVAMLNLALTGVVFALLFIKTGSLWMPIGLHISWNFVQGYVFGIRVSGMDNATSIFRTDFVGNPLFTGGEFGVEGGLVCTAVLVVTIAILFFLAPTSKYADRWTTHSNLPLVRTRKSQENLPTPSTD